MATFKSFEHLPLVIATSLAVPASILTSIWSAVIQGRGEVGFLAKSQAAFAVVSALVAVPLIWYGGLIGLGVSVILAALIPVVGFWSRRPRYLMAAADDKGIRDSLVRAGLSIIATIVIAQVAAYATRLVVVNQLGVFEAGLYQAALAVSGGLPGFVFSAMALDYYPRIAAAKDSGEMARATNMQVQACTVIATPLFVGMIVFGGQLLNFYYTEEFLGAAELMAWMTASVAFRVISWPAGYWLLAKATPKEHLLIEGPAAVLTPLVTIWLLPVAGLAGAGLAMVLAALVYALVVITFMRRRGGLAYTAATWGWAVLGALQVALAFIIANSGVSLLAGGICLAVSLAISLAAYPFIRHAKA
jgi:PST family polysaccharide transporter